MSRMVEEEAGCERGLMGGRDREEVRGSEREQSVRVEEVEVRLCLMKEGGVVGLHVQEKSGVSVLGQEAGRRSGSEQVEAPGPRGQGPEGGAPACQLEGGGVHLEGNKICVTV